jgi:hypothetical protein
MPRYRSLQVHWWRVVLLAILLVCLVAVVAARAAADMKLVPTERIPEANGKARVDAGMLDVRLVGMKPAVLFGGDYNTYVLWLLSPDGITRNMGEFALEGSHSRLVISTELKSFEILVTAEPHYRVTAPSRFVVLQSQVHGEDFPGISYRAGATPYNYERDTLKGIHAAKSNVQTDVHQALAAFRLAQRAHAEEYLGREFNPVREALDRTLRLARERAAGAVIRASARETVELASAAERLLREGVVARQADAASLDKEGDNK